jgi:hypothetical protein
MDGTQPDVSPLCIHIPWPLPFPPAPIGGLPIHAITGTGADDHPAGSTVDLAINTQTGDNAR